MSVGSHRRFVNGHGRSINRAAAPARRRVAICAMAFGLLAAACGTRLSHEELVQSARVRTSGPGLADDALDGTAESTGGAPAGAGEATSTGKTATEGSGRSAEAAGCTGKEKPVIIGSVGWLSGLSEGASYGPKAVQAWAASMNAKGGVDCHPIKVIVEDDQADPGRHQALVQRMVEQDHVIAFLSNVISAGSPGSVDYITKKGIPVIGDATAAQYFYESPMFFPQVSGGEGTVESLFAAAGFQAERTGENRVGVVYCAEDPSCTLLNEVAPEAAKKYSMELVGRWQVSLTQPDFTSTCLQAQRANAQTLVLGLEISSIQRLAQSCRGVNYSPQYAMGLVYLEVGNGRRAALEDPLLNGMMLGGVTIPWTFTDNRGVAEYARVLQQFAPGVEASPMGVSGWVSAKVFERAAQNLSSTPTSQDILNGLATIKNDDIGGMTAPLTYTTGHVPTMPQTACFWLVQIKDGQYVSPNGGKRTC
jgi:branched-chain amino acid transport system substrate-binding protein